jgi:hypothetical protein
MLCIWCIILNKRQRKPTGHIMHNTETLATLGTQDRRGNTECTTQRYWQHWVQKTDGAIQNVQPRDTGNIGYTRPTGQYRMYNPETLATLGTQDRLGNAECTTQRHRQHWVHKTDGEIQNVQPRDTGNIGYTRPTGQYIMYNPETLATLGTQYQRGNTECTTQRHWQHWVRRTQDEDK